MYPVCKKYNNHAINVFDITHIVVKCIILRNLQWGLPENDIAVKAVLREQYYKKILL